MDIKPTARYPFIMPRIRPGFHNLLAQVPDAVWEALAADADAHGESIARRLTTILAKHYRVPADKIPKPRRTGRKPKK